MLEHLIKFYLKMKRVQKVFDNLFWIGSFGCRFLAEIKLESVVELGSTTKHFCPKVGQHEHPVATVQVTVQTFELDRQ